MRKVQRATLTGVRPKRAQAESAQPSNVAGDDVLWSCAKVQAGVVAHRLWSSDHSGQSGDTCSLNVVYTQEAKDEVAKVLASKSYYVGVNGKMNFSAGNDTINYTLASMTS